MSLLAAVRSLRREKMVCEFELILQNIFGFSERPPPPCSKLNFVKIAVVMSRDAGPKKTSFLLQEQESRWDLVGEGVQ